MSITAIGLLVQLARTPALQAGGHGIVPHRVHKMAYSITNQINNKRYVGKMLYDYNEIVELFNLGKSQKEVAELLHCDVTTVSRVLKALIPKRMQTMELRILINLTKTEIIYTMVLIRQLSG